MASSAVILSAMVITGMGQLVVVLDELPTSPSPLFIQINSDRLDDPRPSSSSLDPQTA
ncbi:hypothetical protein BDY24DRAFT_414998 [Mrakia frigida]|uniref:uncharacterized protein n=1 Tax=Mrakia frigida TaxID=29902 RepID=UPI003FCC057D